MIIDPSVSFSARPARGERDRTRLRPVDCFSAAREIVVLPAPEGAERMNIYHLAASDDPIPSLRLYQATLRRANYVLTNRFPLFDVLDLLAHLFDLALHLDGDLRERGVCDLAPIVFTSRLISCNRNSIDFPIGPVRSIKRAWRRQMNPAGGVISSVISPC